MRAVTDPVYVLKRNALIPGAERWAHRHAHRTGEPFNLLFMDRMQILAEQQGLTGTVAAKAGLAAAKPSIRLVVEQGRTVAIVPALNPDRRSA